MKLTFNGHVSDKIEIAIKDVGLLCELLYFLPRSSLLFVNPL